jgi:ketosteroid isomerase-like protein
MKIGQSARAVSVVALAAGLALVLGGGVRAADAPAIEADRTRFEAQVKADVAALDKLLAPELTYVHSSGVLDSKDAYIGAIKSGKTKYKSIVPEEVTARAFGDVTIVNGKATVDLVSDGQDRHLILRYTDVWVKRDGKLQMVSWQATRLNP